MASKYLQKYPVPEDFPDLLHDFAREVLRDQPDNVYEYGAQYFKAMYMVSTGTDSPSAAGRLSVIIQWILVTYLCYLVGCRIRLRKQGQEHPSSQGQDAERSELCGDRA